MLAALFSFICWRVTNRAYSSHCIALARRVRYCCAVPAFTDAILSALDLCLLTHVRGDSNEISPVG
jgi:hypothetical protein